MHQTRFFHIFLSVLISFFLFFSFESFSLAEQVNCEVTIDSYLLSSPIYSNKYQNSSSKNNYKKIAFAIKLISSPESYMYGPESTEGLPTEVRASATFFSGANPQEMKVIAPKPIDKKKTRFANVGSSISSEPTLIYFDSNIFLTALAVPDNHTSDIKVHFSISALLCTATNCTPFEKKLDITLTKEIIQNLSTATFDQLSEVTFPNLPLNNTDFRPQVSDKAFLSQENSINFASFNPIFFTSEQEIQELGSALFFGLLAGFLLNLMPCVLPVLSLKFSVLMAVSGMVDKQKQAKAFKIHCLIFAAGIMTWFIILTCLLGAAGMLWGEIFQSPIVICVLALILFLLGLSLFGVFSLPLIDLKVSSPSHPHWQAYASGILATLLATPCSGPLLGGVLGWALRQSIPVISITIISVGVGMTIPYVIMAFCPRLVHLLPKPGSWTIRLEQLLGFFLMGSVVYLTTLLPVEWMRTFFMDLLAIAFSAWLWGQIGNLNASKIRRVLSKMFAIAIIVLVAWWSFFSINEEQNWESFEPSSFFSLLGKEPLLVNFTADWCPSCKAIEHTTLNEKRLKHLRKKYHMRTIKVDLTRNDAYTKAFLQSMGSSSIPVIALFPKGEKAYSPMVLRDIVTPSQLKTALKNTF